jgi:hypothetical protein
MSTENNTKTIITFAPAGFTLAQSEPNKAGNVTYTGKKQTRKEYAEANNLDVKASTFDDAYRAYLKGLGVQKALVVELMEQNNIPVSALKVSRDKAGKVIGGSVAWREVKAPKVTANQTRLIELEAKNAELAKKLEELSKLLPAPAPAAEGKPAQDQKKKAA